MKKVLFTVENIERLTEIDESFILAKEDRRKFEERVIGKLKKEKETL